MANEVELERMVMRLIGDAESYLQMLKEAEEGTEQTAKEIEDTAKQIEAFGDKMTAAGQQMSLAVTAPLVGLGTWATAVYGVQEKAEITLRGIIAANERASATLFKDYAAYSSGLQQLTVTGDETTLAMFRTAESLGITGEAAKTAIKEAMGLGAAIGMSTRSAIRYTAALADGDTMMLNRYIPALKMIEDQDERVAEAHKRLGRMFAVAEAEADTFIGTIQQMWNSVGDLMEQFGEITSGYLKPLIRYVKEVSDWFQTLPRPVKETIVVLGALAASIGPVLLGLGTMIKLLPLVSAGWTALAANPVILAVAALAIGVTALASAWVEHNRVVEEGNSIATKAVDAINSQIAAKRDQADALYKLTEQEALAGEEMQRAQDLVKDLERYYGDLGIELDELTGKFTGVTSAILAMSDANRRMAIGGLERKIKDLTNQLQEAQETVSGGGRWGRFGATLKETEGIGEVGGAFGQLFTSTDAARVKVKQLQATIDEARQSLADLQAGGELPGGTTQMEEVLNQANEEAQKLTDTLMSQLRTYSMTATERQVDALRQAGTDEAEIERVEKLLTLIDLKADARKREAEAVKETAKAQAKAEREYDRVAGRAEMLGEQFATPFEAAQRKIADYTRLLDVLGEEQFGDTFRRATKAAIEDYQQAVGGVERIQPQAVQTIRRGSVAEQLLIQESRLAMSVQEPTQAQDDSRNLGAIATATATTLPGKFDELIKALQDGGFLPADLGGES